MISLGCNQLEESSNAKEKVRFLLSHVGKEDFIFYCLQTQNHQGRPNYYFKPISNEQRLEIVQFQLDQMIKVGNRVRCFHRPAHIHEPSVLSFLAPTMDNYLIIFYCNFKILNLESDWNIFLADKDSRLGLCYKCDLYFLQYSKSPVDNRCKIKHQLSNFGKERNKNFYRCALCCQGNELTISCQR